MSAFNCSCPPEAVDSDPDIAGIGVLLSFMLTAFASVVVSAFIIFQENRKSYVRSVRKLLLSFSDQQIVTGIVLQGIGLMKMKSLVPYHFFILWMLSLLSTVTHINTLLALVYDFKRDWILRWLRQFFMFINLVLSVSCGIVLLMVVLKDLDPTLPIACVWEVPSTRTPPNVWISITGTIAVIAGQGIFFVASIWYLHIREHQKMPLIQKSGLVFFTTVGIGAAARIILVSHAFGSPSVPLADNEENVWDFGQLLSIFLLILPFVAVIEKSPVKGNFSTNPNYPDAISRKPVKSGTASSFDPNPLWGHRSGNIP